jgi:hypothetical protein
MGLFGSKSKPQQEVALPGQQCLLLWLPLGFHGLQQQHEWVLMAAV